MSEADEANLRLEYKKNQATARMIGFAALGVLLFGATFYHYVEGLKWLDAFYFCMITLTTVGYGDISPHTDIGKLFTMFYVVIGIGIIGGFANFLLKNTMVRRELKKLDKHRKANS